MDWVQIILRFQNFYQFTDRQMAFRMRLSIRKYKLLKINPKLLGVELLRVKKDLVFFDRRNQMVQAKQSLEKQLSLLNELIPNNSYIELNNQMREIQRMIEGLKQKR